MQDDRDAEAAARLAPYLALVKARPDAFCNPDPAGVVILTEPADILAAEAEIKARYTARGIPAEWAEGGLFYEDPWMYLTRDIVRFPDGAAGTYHHIVLKGGGNGVVVLPILQGDIVLLRHFRNGARGWSWEIPRGGPQPGDPEANARAELEEEIGAGIERIERLGSMRNNNGMITEVMHIYAARISETGAMALGEGIDRVRRVSPATLAGMLRTGEVDDCHTAHAFLLARLNGLI